MNEGKFIDTNAEKAAIGALILDGINGGKSIYNAVLNTGGSRVWFTDPLCRAVFAVIFNRIQSNQPIDMILIADEIYKANPTLTDNIPTAMTSWCDLCVSVHHGQYYFSILKTKWQQREVYKKLCAGMEKLESLAPLSEIVSDIRHDLTLVPDTQYVMENNGSIIASSIADFMLAKDKGYSGCPSRWFRFQEKFGGWPKGKMSLVAGRPKQGKSTLANNETAYLALRGVPCAVASMEMSKKEWLTNAICAEAGLDAKKFRRGKFTSDEMKAYRAMGDRFDKAPLTIDDRTHTIGSLCTFIRDMAADKKCEMVVFDYIGLIKQEEGGKAKTRNEEVGSWSSQLSNTAKELPNTAVVGISQLNRGMTGMDKGKPIVVRPELHHLRDSGALEQDAYMIVFVYQDPRVGAVDYENNAPTIIRVAALRGGTTGEIEMTFEKEKQRLVEPNVSHDIPVGMGDEPF